MKLRGLIFSAAFVAASAAALPAGSASAQSLPYLGNIIGSHGHVNVGSAINMGIGIAQDAYRRHQKELAAQHERARVAELQKTKAGRAQLARERAAAQKRAQAQARAINNLGRVLFSGGGGGGGGGGSGTGPCGSSPGTAPVYVEGRWDCR